MMHIGIDIGGTNIKFGIINSKAKIITNSSLPTNIGSGYLSIINKVIKIINNLRYIFDDIQSIGIGVPGVVNFDGVVKVAPNFPDWIDIPLKELIMENVTLPVDIDNDANTAALAELEFGAGKGLNNFLYVTLGTGVGGCIIFDRKVFRGSTGGAGEIGHTIINSLIQDEDQIVDYKNGTLESLTGRSAIIDRAKNLLKYACSPLSEIEEFDVFDISNTAGKGDNVSIDILKETGEYLGIGLASAMNLLDIPVVIIGGGISQSNEALFDSALQTIKRRALPTISKRAELRKAHFVQNTGIVGAAILGMNLLKKKYD